MSLYLKDGTIFTEDGYEISDPAVMFDTCDGVLHKYGNFNEVLSVFNAWIKADKARIISKDLMVFHFDTTAFTKEQIIEILDKMIGISGYCGVFYNKVMLGNLD